ncbi:MAG: DUF4407 domain-containing protein [Sediminibacterium sp.]|nr:DUF4407 domain-containing protein [Sediminibacterium sp.]
MVVNTYPLARRRFLWWLATAEEALLKNCLVDQNRYAIIGMLVLGTWMFATLAWTYFFSTVVQPFGIAMLLGIFMGWIILQIDRALIKGIKRKGKQLYLSVLFRCILATSIGLFMAQPALIFLFEKEINLQVSIDNELRKKEKRQLQENVIGLEKNAFLNKKKAAKNELDSLYSAVNSARAAFIAETDGTGGSKKIGLKDIAMAKQAAYLKLDADYQQRVAALTPQIQYADSSLKAIDASIQHEQEQFQLLLNNGFITRIEALNHLVQNNTSVAFRYYLLVMILLLIELMPVLAKLLLPEGTYDLNVALQEELEQKMALNNQAQTNLFFEEMQPTFRDRTSEKIKYWKADTSSTYDALWDDFKKTMLTNNNY